MSWPVDNNKSISLYFNIIKIDGDGKCAFRAILEALNISQIWHKALRALAANAIEEKQWNLEILEALNIESPKQLADQTRKENSFVGEATIAELAEKLELTIAIYLKDTTLKKDKKKYTLNIFKVTILNWTWKAITTLWYLNKILDSSQPKE